jgi:hypothetical protein
LQPRQTASPIPVEHTPIQGVLTRAAPETEVFRFKGLVIPEV